MKRLIPAVCCLVAAFALSAGSYLYIRSQTRSLCEKLESIVSADGERAFDEAKSVCSYWNGVRTSFGALLKHSDADELEKCFMKIDACSPAGGEEELKEAAGGCIIALRVILKGEKADAANIF